MLLPTKHASIVLVQSGGACGARNARRIAGGWRAAAVVHTIAIVALVRRAAGGIVDRVIAENVNGAVPLADAALGLVLRSRDSTYGEAQIMRLDGCAQVVGFRRCTRNDGAGWRVREYGTRGTEFGWTEVKVGEFVARRVCGTCCARADARAWIEIFFIDCRCCRDACESVCT